MVTRVLCNVGKITLLARSLFDLYSDFTFFLLDLVYGDENSTAR